MAEDSVRYWPTEKAKREKALEVARDYAGCEGDHHRMWVIDQMVRALTGEHYDEWVQDYEFGGCGWDTGVAP